MLFVEFVARPRTALESISAALRARAGKRLALHAPAATAAPARRVAGHVRLVRAEQGAREQLGPATMALAVSHSHQRVAGLHHVVAVAVRGLEALQRGLC